MPHAVPPQLVGRRADFPINNLHDYLDFVESRVEQAVEEEREQERSVHQAQSNLCRDDIPTRWRPGNG